MRLRTGTDTVRVSFSEEERSRLFGERRPVALTGTSSTSAGCPSLVTCERFSEVSGALLESAMAKGDSATGEEGAVEDPPAALVVVWESAVFVAPCVVAEAPAVEACAAWLEIASALDADRGEVVD